MVKTKTKVKGINTKEQQHEGVQMVLGRYGLVASLNKARCIQHFMQCCSMGNAASS
jgi:hypothetical protein